MVTLYPSIDNVNERRLQARAAHEEAINILLLAQIRAVLLAHAASVYDPGVLFGRLGELAQPFSDGGVHLLRLLCRRDLASADGPTVVSVIVPLFPRYMESTGSRRGEQDLSPEDSPDRLVCNHNLAPIRNLVGNSLQLMCDDADGLVLLALLRFDQLPSRRHTLLSLTSSVSPQQSITLRPPSIAAFVLLATNYHSLVSCTQGPVTPTAYLIRLVQKLSPLAVTEDGPCDVTVLQLRCADLACVCAVGLVEDVLGRDFDAGPQVFACQE